VSKGGGLTGKIDNYFPRVAGGRGEVIKSHGEEEREQGIPTTPPRNKKTHATIFNVKTWGEGGVPR